MSENEPFVTIRSCTGNFAINKPNQETTRVLIKIPAYDYKEEIGFNPADLHVDPEHEPWHHAIDELTVSSPKYIGGKDKIEELEEILNEHYNEIKQEWKQHREQEIEDEIESLKQEKQEL